MVERCSLNSSVTLCCPTACVRACRYVERFYSDSSDVGLRATTVRTAMVGSYWVGSYEHRPTPGSPRGGYQGDEPVGMMWSAPFVVGGDSMSLLVGGGCTIHSVYVELIVMISVL